MDNPTILTLLAAVRLSRDQHEQCADMLDQAIADIEVALGRRMPLAVFVDPPSWDAPVLTDISLAGGAAVFHVGGGMS